MTDQHAADHPLVDIDHVVREPAAVRIAGQVAADHAQAADLAGRRRRDRQVEPQLVGQGRPGVVERGRLQAGEQDLHEVTAAGVGERPELRIELLQHRGQDRVRVVLRELLVVCRRAGVPVILEVGRDEDLVDQRIAQPGDLHPVARQLPVAHGQLLAVGRRPDADRVIAAVVERGLRDLQRDRMHAVAREEVLAAAGGAGSVADRHEVEDRSDVCEERIVTLPGEDRRAVGQRMNSRNREAVVVRGRARSDVVRRGHAAPT